MSSENVEIFERMKNDLKNQARFTSLKKMCAREVVEYLPLYVKNGLTSLVSILPKALYNCVYQEFEDKYNIILSHPNVSEHDWLSMFNRDLVVSLLLFAGDAVIEEFNCKILNIPGESFECRVPQFRGTFFQRLGTGCPKLKALKDVDVKPWDTLDQLFSDHYSLQSMPNLVILENSFYPVKDGDLQVIGHCLPLLQRLLLLPADDISYAGLKELTNLNRLKHLTLAKDCVQLVTHCLLLMPQVSTVCRDKDNKFSPHKFPTYEVTMELGLEHLVLGQNSVIPAYVSLPKVTQITVNVATTVSLLQFKKLKDLTLLMDDSDWPEIEHLFTNNELGQSLQRFHLSCQTAHLMRVFQLCPHLEELKFSKVDFIGDFNASQLSTHVNKLKSFHHVKNNDSEDDDGSFQSNGLLFLLLTSCPHLEELKLETISLGLDEPDLEDISNSDLLPTKLQKVSISALLFKEDVVDYSNLVINLCDQNCHSLKEVCIEAFGENGDKNDCFEEPEYQLAQEVQYFINKHKYYSHLKNKLLF